MEDTPIYTQILRPAESVTVAGDRRVVLYDHEDRPLVRMIGFAPPRRVVPSQSQRPEKAKTSC